MINWSLRSVTDSEELLREYYEPINIKNVKNRTDLFHFLKKDFRAELQSVMSLGSSDPMLKNLQFDLDKLGYLKAGYKGRVGYWIRKTEALTTYLEANNISSDRYGVAGKANGIKSPKIEEKELPF